MSNHCKLCNYNSPGFKHWLNHLKTNKHKTNYAKYPHKIKRKCSKCDRSKPDFFFLKPSPMTPFGTPRVEEYYQLCDWCRLMFKTKWKK